MFTTCPDCGFTADVSMFNTEMTDQGLGAVTTEAECPECGNWHLLDWSLTVSLFN